MDLKQIKELMVAMGKAGIKKLIFKEKSGQEIHLERQDDAVSPESTSVRPHVFSREGEFHPPVPPPLVQKPMQETSEEGKFIVAPLVGTFYAAPSPEDPSYVKVGDCVDENTIVGIIEAMKVMNEVKAGMSGTIAEVLVENAHPVEFNSKMFRIISTS
jgi:acetyl-CoA carboxylase biotin carboxyl carrier protein